MTKKNSYSCVLLLLSNMIQAAPPKIAIQTVCPEVPSWKTALAVAGVSTVMTAFFISRFQLPKQSVDAVQDVIQASLGPVQERLSKLEGTVSAYEDHITALQLSIATLSEQVQTIVVSEKSPGAAFSPLPEGLQESTAFSVPAADAGIDGSLVMVPQSASEHLMADHDSLLDGVSSRK